MSHTYERWDRTRTPFNNTNDMYRSHIDFLTQFTVRTSRACAHQSFPSRCLRFLIGRRYQH